VVAVDSDYKGQLGCTSRGGTCRAARVRLSGLLITVLLLLLQRLQLVRIVVKVLIVQQLAQRLHFLSCSSRGGSAMKPLLLLLLLLGCKGGRCWYRQCG